MKFRAALFLVVAAVLWSLGDYGRHHRSSFGDTALSAGVQARNGKLSGLTGIIQENTAAAADE